MNKTHTLSVIVENKPGVLARISGLFARRGYNIESLAVGPTERPEISRITIQVAVDSPAVLEQITKQLNKLVEVLKIVELEESAVRRELVLVKLKADPASRSQIIEIVQLFRGKTVDVHQDSLVVEATGSPDKLEALLEMLRPYGVRELVQSGLVALGRGSKSLTDRSAKVDRARPGVR
ncbi:acetolactate synthase small subunit [Propioniciclava sp. MC1595]|uniref:acetolactate synthase small subunit n=1 Tax=Propioniciclava sp. MC1595 TaxID=2760308 RepID=UPI0016621E43|nr:acetolactate synthase small subunit [Propioniciclava sp. MC1595]MBB1494649.1 acetolactate synthase small subunit [Propioniciclava sp. MC1595]QTE27359.1 acetolactate synthase small subunit [Propioniciclava sp. MC1595]